MEDLEEKFKDQWPEMFRDVRYGFYLPERWDLLVWGLCEHIARSLSSSYLPRGAVRVAQVKEKFGGLRFYYDWTLKDGQTSEALPSLEAGVRGYVSGLVEMAEVASFLIK